MVKKIHRGYEIHIYDTHCSVYDRGACVHVADGGWHAAVLWIDKVERIKP